ncbi:MAG: AMP-binding protein, partial [Alphaproteobacteria bacterium]
MAGPVWNFADVWELVAAKQGERLAIVQGGKVLTWAEFDARSDALAQAFVAAGAGRQAKIGCYLANSAEYMITVFAAFKAGMVPFNVNYRYGSEELAYLFDNADAEIVVFDAEYADKIAPLRARLPGVKAWIVHGEPAPPWALDLADLTVQKAPSRFRAPWGRSGRDEMFIYTGGTTGMPKGVMWRQEDLFAASRYYENVPLNIPGLETPEDAPGRAAIHGRGVLLIASPLMHATALI